MTTTTKVQVKQHDIGVLFTDTLTVEGVDFGDLTVTVKFLMRHQSGTPNLSKDAVAVVDGDGNLAVTYTTVDGDLDTAGVYRQEWEVSVSGGARWTFPSYGWNTVDVLADLNET